MHANLVLAGGAGGVPRRRAHFEHHAYGPSNGVKKEFA
jgi:hypothetical protein